MCCEQKKKNKGRCSLVLHRCALLFLACPANQMVTAPPFVYREPVKVYNYIHNTTAIDRAVHCRSSLQGILVSWKHDM